jgi:hypothetical protein
VWSAWSVGVRRPDARDGPAAADDPYLVLATDWLWGRYDRAVGAHTRADDRLALADARTLATAEWPAAEAEAKRRKFKPLTVGGDDDTIFTFLDELPRLLADQERRARQPARQSALGAGPRAFTDRAAYIAGLIADFEHEGAVPPAVVGPNGESVREALVKEGEVAVEPLIRCVEEDSRLTRYAPDYEEYDTYRQVQSVRESALYAVQDILGEQFDAEFVPQADREPDKRVVAEQVRAHWAKFKGRRAGRAGVPDARRRRRRVRAVGTGGGEHLRAARRPTGNRADHPYPPHFIIDTVDRPGRKPAAATGRRAAGPEEPVR